MPLTNMSDEMRARLLLDRFLAGEIGGPEFNIFSPPL